MRVEIGPLSEPDRHPAVDIFNHYVEHGFAAYPEARIPHQVFDALWKAAAGYPAVVARSETGEVVGFGMLRPYHPLSTFSGVAEITYFIKPGFTGTGIGRRMLDALVRGAVEKGLTSILASISSLNEGSIRFHAKNGFSECGLFRRIGKKNGQVFDVVWMQRML